MNHLKDDQDDGLRICGQPAVTAYLNGHAHPVNACFAHAQRERSLHLAKQMRLPINQREEFTVYPAPTEAGATCECVVAVGKPAPRNHVQFRDEFKGV